MTDYRRTGAQLERGWGKGSAERDPAQANGGAISPAAPRSPGLPPALAAIVGSVMVGFMPLLVVDLYGGGIGAVSMLVWRYGLALPPLFAAAALARHDFGAAWRSGAWRIALVGATLGAGQTLCFWESLHTLDTSIAVLLFYTYPALTLVLDRLLFKRPIRWRAAGCVGLILLGAGLITLPGLGGGLDPRGLAWILPSPLIYALYLAANSVLMRRHPPLIGALYLYLGLALAFGGASLFLGLDIPSRRETWFVLLIIALGPGAMTVTLFSYSVPRLGPSSYAIIANTELLTVVTIGVAVLGERLTSGRLAGGVLIVCGILAHGMPHRAGARTRSRNMIYHFFSKKEKNNFTIR